MKAEIEVFAVGDVVTWGSQSQGSFKQKTGYVAAVIQAHSRPEAMEWPQLFSGAGPGSARRHQSYIVVADKRVYWPIARKLKRAEWRRENRNERYEN